MFRTFVLVAVFVGFIASVVPSAKPLAAQAPASTPAARAGQEVFTKNCMQCHSVVEGQYSFGPNLKGEMKKPTGTAVKIRGYLKNGNEGKIGKMPSFDGKLTPVDINNLLAYLKTV